MDNAISVSACSSWQCSVRATKTKRARVSSRPRAGWSGERLRASYGNLRQDWDDVRRGRRRKRSHVAGERIRQGGEADHGERHVSEGVDLGDFESLIIAI